MSLSNADFRSFMAVPRAVKAKDAQKQKGSMTPYIKQHNTNTKNDQQYKSVDESNHQSHQRNELHENNESASNERNKQLARRTTTQEQPEAIGAKSGLDRTLLQKQRNKIQQDQSRQEATITEIAAVTAKHIHDKALPDLESILQRTMEIFCGHRFEARAIASKQKLYEKRRDELYTYWQFDLTNTNTEVPRRVVNNAAILKHNDHDQVQENILKELSKGVQQRQSHRTQAIDNNSSITSVNHEAVQTISIFDDVDNEYKPDTSQLKTKYSQPLSSIIRDTPKTIPTGHSGPKVAQQSQRYDLSDEEDLSKMYAEAGNTDLQAVDEVDEDTLTTLSNPSRSRTAGKVQSNSYLLEEEIGFVSDHHLGHAFDETRDMDSQDDMADLARLKAQWNFNPEESKKSTRTEKSRKRKKEEGENVEKVSKVMHEKHGRKLM